MADRIKGHNNKVWKQQQQHSSTEQRQQTCNCKQKSECPLNRNGLQSGLVYQATIETDAQLKNTSHLRKATLKPTIEIKLNLLTTKNTKWKPSY